MRLFFFFALFSLCACSTSPTGRSQLNLLPERQIDQMGQQSFSEIKKKERLSSNAHYLKVTECVVSELLQNNGLKPAEWELKVFASDQLNAFALPGKKIGVYEGIFKAAKNEHQLAAVIGHEIGHVIAEHGNERVSQQLLAQGTLVAADLAIDQKNSNRKMILMGLGLGANFGVILPFSRKHELEADELGVNYMAKAGFNPDEAVELWRNMAAAGGKGGPEFLSTHPNPSHRMDDIRSQLPKARRLQQQAIESHGAPECAL